MSHRDSREEKLIEEIRAYWREGCQCRGDDGECFEEAGDYCGAIAQKSIARIGKAYADGELELPGEAGRFPASRQIPGWTRGWILQMLSKGAKNFIALRKEEDK